MYTLDTDNARKADQRGGTINETGKYIGRFVRAEDITTEKNTRGVDFSFVAEDGRRCRFSLYTVKGDGSRINIGHGYLMAMMTCLRLRELKPQPMMVKKWDNDSNTEIDTRVPCFADLMGKPVGVLLEAEEYMKRDGSLGSKMVLAGVFDPATELTASEILDRRVKPEQLAKIVATLRDRPLKPTKKASASTAPGRSRAEAWDAGSAGDPDAEIPF